MKQLYIYLVIFLLCISCSPIKFKGYIDDEIFVNIKGKINSITCLSIIEKNRFDTIKTINFYNSKRLPLKQIEFYKNETLTTVYKYDTKNRLIEEIINDTNDSLIYRYKYDKKNNLITYQNLKNSFVNVETNYHYDKRNNPIKVINSNGTKNETSTYSNDYKKRIVTIENSSYEISNKITYNKKGYITLSEIYFISKKITNKSTREYDKNENLVKRVGYLNDKINFIEERQNIYDTKKNLIESLIFEDGKLIKKLIFKIDYK